MGQVETTGIRSFAASAALTPHLRVVYDATNGLAAAGPEDKELGVLRNRHIVSGVGASEQAPVVLRIAAGTVKMVAAGALSAWDTVYGAEGGKVDDTPNANPIGIACEAAGADGDYIEVIRVEGGDGASQPHIGEAPGIDLFYDFEGDWPAAATALTELPWTKVETNGLGVTSSDEPNGVLKFAFDAVAEAATSALYMQAAPVHPSTNPIIEFRLAIFEIGDDADVDINFGLVNDTHATDADSITDSIFFHLDSNDLSVLAECDDGTNETAAVDTTIALTDDTYARFKIDVSDLSDIKLYIDLEDGAGYVRVLSTTTFSVAAMTNALTPIVHVEKASTDCLIDARLDWIRIRAGRYVA